MSFDHSRKTEDIASAATASNSAALTRCWGLLGKACRGIVDSRGGRPGLEPVLRAVLEATGMERAFVVSRTAAKSTRIEAAVSLRRDGRERPSRTVVERALQSSRPVFYPNAPEDRRLTIGGSIRSLELRCIIAVPVPLPDPTAGGRASLLLDSRVGPPLGEDGCSGAMTAWVGQLLEGFASLSGLVLSTRGVAPAPHPRADGAELVGRSRSFLAMQRWLQRVAPYHFPVLITGESGSGKEGVARALHRAGRCRSGPFLAINCAAFPETLLESELFGAVRGAYTGSERDRPGLFRRAAGGTLFLDEIGDMPLAMQAKLLRVLQDRRVRPVGGDDEIDVDVRTIAATHRALPAEVAAGRFRADLYHRIAVVEVRVPPLRERLDDLPLLCERLLGRISGEYGIGTASLHPDAFARLEDHDWPGNVRELQGVLLRGLLRCRDHEIRPGDLDLWGVAERPAGDTPRASPLERSMIESALSRSGGNIARAAKRIGWTRQKLYRRMHALGIRRHR